MVDPITANGVTAALRHAAEASRLILKYRKAGKVPWLSKLAYSSRILQVAKFFNSGIEKVVYDTPVRNRIGVRTAGTVYTSPAWSMNVVYARLKPKGILLHLVVEFVSGILPRQRVDISFSLQAAAAGGRSGKLKGRSMYLLSRGTGYPVLFIHGIPTSGQLWNGVIEKLGGQYTCMAVDLPGLGRSPKAPYGPKHLEALADQIEQIRIENNIEKWHVVGHDAGSAVAVHYAYRFQERVDRLALLSPAVFPELKPFHLFRIMRKPVIGELLAPIVNSIFWNVAMRYAVQDREEHTDTVKDFQAPFSGPLGAWRMMSMLRWGNPEEVLAAIPRDVAAACRSHPDLPRLSR